MDGMNLPALIEGEVGARTPIEGEKGGGKEPTITPNSLRSKMTMDVIYLLGEGPQQGLWDGGKSIFIGEPPVPLVAADGNANYQGIEWEYRDGSPSQAPFYGVPTAQTTIPVGIQITKGGGSVTQAYDCTLADRLRVILQFPALVSVNSKTGDQWPVSVAFHVEWRVSGSGGSWITLFSDMVSGKCTSPYARAITWPVPQRAILDIRITRDTDDSTTADLQNDLYWFSTVIITDRLLEYPSSALVRMKVDAEQFGQSPPMATFGVNQLLCWVPTNYDPASRTYATSGPGTSGGIWDGTFKRAFSNNAAWVWWTLAQDPTFGCGRELVNSVDRYATYRIAQYCDEMVPDGYGGFEPRYTVNCYINTKDEAVRVLQAVAQAFRGMLYYGGGQVVPVADMPTNPVKAVTPANVIEGRFEYQGASLNSRHNLIKVRFRDPAVYYRESIEVVQDSESIALYGMIKEKDLDAFGCTSRAMARRLGRWILYTEKYEDETVTYKAFRDHANVMPGDIITVSDPVRIGTSMGGRLVAAATTNTVQLDRTLQLLTGVSYAFRVQLPDGTLSDPLPITNTLPSTTDTLTIGGAGLPADNLPQSYAVWVLTAGSPWTYRVLDVTPNKDETYTITAVRSLASKYGYVEQGLDLEDSPFTIFPTVTGPLEPPTNLDVQEYLVGVGITALVRVVLSWSPSGDRRTTGYQAQALQNGVVVRDVQTDNIQAEFPDLVPGDYVFQARTIGRDGMASGWVATATITVDGTPDPPAAPNTLGAQGTLKAIVVTWLGPVAKYLRNVEVWASSSASFAGATKVGVSSTGRFVHQPLAPSSTWYYWVRSVDIFDQYSAFVGPAIGTASYLLTNDIADAVLNAAKFAQGIKPVKIIATNTAVTDIEGGVIADGDIAVCVADGKLYKREGGVWVCLSDASQIVGQLTAGQIAAGAIGTTQLAAQAVRAANLAAEELIANTIQVKDLIIGTRKLEPQSISNVFMTERWDSIFVPANTWTTVADLSFYVPDTYAGPGWVVGQSDLDGGYVIVAGDPDAGLPRRVSSARIVIDGMVYYESSDSGPGSQEIRPPINRGRFLAMASGWHYAQLQISDVKRITKWDFVLTGYRYFQLFLVKR